MPLVSGGRARQVHEWWTGFSDRLLARAVDRLQRAERVITDRLHGAIVARLAGVPVVLVDNSYGKLSAYYDAWWRDDPAIRLADGEIEGVPGAPGA